MSKDLSEDQMSLIKNGEKIDIDFDNCDVKENNYSKDITNRGMSRFDIANSGYKEKSIEQSVIIYNHKKGEVKEKYISQTFPSNAITLSTHIINGDIVLYVDRLDRSKYFFYFTPKPFQ